MLVIKLDHTGREVVRYEAQRLPTTIPNGIVVRAEWQTPTIQTETTTFATGDYLHEFFYTDRWYNVFALYSGETGALKGWYCNVTRPVAITENEIRWTDLELDVWVSSQGSVTVLDREEFDRLKLHHEEVERCLNALRSIEMLVNLNRLPK